MRAVCGGERGAGLVSRAPRCAGRCAGRCDGRRQPPQVTAHGSVLGRGGWSFTLRAPIEEAAFARALSLSATDPVGWCSLSPSPVGALGRPTQCPTPDSGRVAAKPQKDRHGPPSDLPTRKTLIPAHSRVVFEEGNSPSLRLSEANELPGCCALEPYPAFWYRAFQRRGVGSFLLLHGTVGGSSCWKGQHALISNNGNESLCLRI